MIKTVLVPLNGTSADETVLTAASLLAQPFAAHLACVRVEPDLGHLAAQSVQPSFDEERPVGSERLKAQQSEAEQATGDARAHFDAICQSKMVMRADAPQHVDKASAAFRVQQGGTAEVLLKLARFHDLVVATVTPGAALEEGPLGELILQSGRPVLLAPTAIPSRLIGTIAVAWKNTAQAARAVTAAMPFLHKARRIEVLISNEDGAEALDCLDCTDSVVQQLRWHGLHAEARYIIPGGRTAPDAVLQTAGELGADLLVMGAYGHRRLREQVFGGFTRRILRGTEIPVLLSH